MDMNSFYLGKKVAFVYRASKEVRGSKIRVIWGKVTRPHGTPIRSLEAHSRFSNSYIRQLWRRQGSVPQQPPSSLIRCHRPRHALPIFDISAGRCSLWEQERMRRW